MKAERNTIQKRLIIDAVKELAGHVTAEQVHDEIVKKHPTISRATVYRNLNKMASAGEVLNIGNFYGAAHYDHMTHRHCHFVCDGCKKVFDIDGDFSDITVRAENTSGFDVSGCSVCFNGLCRNCKGVS